MLFRSLPFGEEQVTNNEGIAQFPIPENIPGDSEGNLRFSAKFSDDEAFGDFSRDTILRAGEITIPVSLVAKRAMWNSAAKAPVWIIALFVGGMFSVWSFIFFILLKLRDVFVIGKTVLNKDKDKSYKST